MTIDTLQGEVNVGAKESNFEFCICYQADNGIEYWDSNEGLNYKLAGEECPNTAPLSPPSVGNFLFGDLYVNSTLSASEQSAD